MFRAPQRLVEDFKTTSRVAGGVSSQAAGGCGTRRGIGASGDARRHATTLVSHFYSPTSYKTVQVKEREEWELCARRSHAHVSHAHVSR